VTVKRIVVAAGAAIVRGLSEPSGAAKKYAGRNAVAAPLFDGIVPVVALVLVDGDVTVSLVAGLLAVVALVVAELDVVTLVDDEPHPASGRAAARVARAAPVAARLIDGPSDADNSLEAFRCDQLADGDRQGFSSMTRTAAGCGSTGSGATTAPAARWSR
jgi:hypothetical protein